MKVVLNICVCIHTHTDTHIYVHTYIFRHNYYNSIFRIKYNLMIKVSLVQVTYLENLVVVVIHSFMHQAWLPFLEKGEIVVSRMDLVLAEFFHGVEEGQ